MSMRRSFRSTVQTLFAAPVVALFACNGILGTSDYKVGEGTDEGAGGDPSQSDGGEGNMGTGGLPGAGATTGSGGGATGSGGRATGSGGRATGGSGGKASGTGGLPPGGGGAGGKGSGGATNPGTGGSGGSLTADDFIGEWDTDAETQTTECNDGLAPTTEVASNVIEWTPGSVGTIEALYGPSCILVSRISGRVATGVASPPCSESGISYTATGTFTILANGTARMDHKYVLSMPPDTCTITATGIFTKYAPPTF
jgi:hypothetical protein